PGPQGGPRLVPRTDSEDISCLSQDDCLVDEARRRGGNHGAGPSPRASEQVSGLRTLRRPTTRDLVPHTGEEEVVRSPGASWSAPGNHDHRAYPEGEAGAATSPAETNEIRGSAHGHGPASQPCLAYRSDHGAHATG